MTKKEIRKKKKKWNHVLPLRNARWCGPVDKYCTRDGYLPPLQHYYIGACHIFNSHLFSNFTRPRPRPRPFFAVAAAASTAALHSALPRVSLRLPLLLLLLLRHCVFVCGFSSINALKLKRNDDIHFLKVMVFVLLFSGIDDFPLPFLSLLNFLSAPFAFYVRAGASSITPSLHLNFASLSLSLSYFFCLPTLSLLLFFFFFGKISVLFLFCLLFFVFLLPP